MRKSAVDPNLQQAVSCSPATSVTQSCLRQLTLVPICLGPVDCLRVSLGGGWRAICSRGKSSTRHCVTQHGRRVSAPTRGDANDRLVGAATTTVCCRRAPLGSFAKLGPARCANEPSPPAFSLAGSACDRADFVFPARSVSLAVPSFALRTAHASPSSSTFGACVHFQAPRVFVLRGGASQDRCRPSRFRLPRRAS